jgi:t-SNARE complex subunit (syntaxin)
MQLRLALCIFAEILIRNRDKRADAEAQPNAEQWRVLDEANIEGDIVKQRQDDLNQIEKLMHEVNLMTKDMAVEIDNADQKLDLIGQNARATKNNAKNALVNVAKGAEYQGKSYKKM